MVDNVQRKRKETKKKNSAFCVLRFRLPKGQVRQYNRVVSTPPITTSIYHPLIMGIIQVFNERYCETLMRKFISEITEAPLLTAHYPHHYPLCKYYASVYWISISERKFNRNAKENCFTEVRFLVSLCLSFVLFL